MSHRQLSRREEKESGREGKKKRDNFTERTLCDDFAILSANRYEL